MRGLACFLTNLTAAAMVACALVPVLLAPCPPPASVLAGEAPDGLPEPPRPWTGCRCLSGEVSVSTWDPSGDPADPTRRDSVVLDNDFKGGPDGTLPETVSTLHRLAPGCRVWQRRVVAYNSDGPDTYGWFRTNSELVAFPEPNAWICCSKLRATAVLDCTGKYVVQVEFRP